MPPQMTCASALPGKTGKHENRIFPSTAASVHCPNSTICLISSIVLTHDSYLRCSAAVWLPKSCNQCVQLEAVGAWFRINEVMSTAWWTVLHAQYNNALSSGFPISQGNAEALDRWGRKAKHRLISYFLSNSSAKNDRNLIVYVKIIASERWDVFKTQCI